MQKHVSKQRPRLMQQIIQRGRSFELGKDEFVNRIILKKKAQEIKNCEEEKHTSVYKNQFHYHVAIAKLILNVVSNGARQHAE